MTDDDLIKFATEFREGILGGRESAWMCAAVCWPLASLLSLHGVKATPVETDLGEMNHVWLRLEDGRALDPTGDQFNAYGFQPTMPAVYLGPPMKYHGVIE